MRSLAETQTRWHKTQAHTSTLADLQNAIKSSAASSPCVSGCRSICWKIFLLFKDESDAGWSQILHEARSKYGEQRDHLLRFIKHPEALAELTLDPLADDPDSPWRTVREDEVIRGEILQDVQRLPDEANYHDARIQTMILDILFIYCKLNPSRGGYRQGMHELLAPIVHVIEQDAVDCAAVGNNQSLDDAMLEILDSTFIEHDSYTLFSCIMEHAQSFYELKEAVEPVPSDPRPQEASSTIVERSKFIHEVCLNKVDPELASHLTSIEILPQIFLIRWVRLLFSREFPFEQFLLLWDIIFAVDPSLDLIDLVCVAMLIRLRWQLLEADYSVCLQLLLRYPPPAKPNGPQTFVDDALYLRGHLNASGGASLIMKYSGKMPTVSQLSDGARPATPNFRGFSSLRQKGLGVGSRLGSPPGFNQVGVEALFQGAAKGAKGVLERGEKLGINQAVRDAMGEIRRNMQGLNESKLSRSPMDVLTDEGAVKALAAMERRNRQLANMLDETVANLKAISASSMEDQAKSLELIEIAAAKVQFVQIYLEDSTMEVPMIEPVAESPQVATSEKDFNGQLDEKLHVESNSSPPEAQVDALADVHVSALSLDENPGVVESEPGPPPQPGAMDTKDEGALSAPLATTARIQRPAAIPTRSTLAQSSFSWMLEPEHSKSSPSLQTASKAPPGQHKKRSSNNISRERNAFLFGEVTAETEGPEPPNSDEIFGMETIHKANSKQ